MFECVYGFSCIENQVLAQVALQGNDIKPLYGASFIDFKKLLRHIMATGGRPEQFSLIPRIQDALKALGVISLELKSTDNINDVLRDISQKKIFARVKPDFVKKTLLARGFRPDHYVLAEKQDQNLKITNDIPERVVMLSQTEFTDVYDGNYFVFGIKRRLSQADYEKFLIKKEEKLDEDVVFAADIYRNISDLCYRISSFFCIYKTIVNRITELYYSPLGEITVAKYRNKINSLYAQSEYLRLKKSADKALCIEMLNQAFEIHRKIAQSITNRRK